MGNAGRDGGEYYTPALAAAGWSVVEAKAWDKALTEDVGQAKDYAGKLAIRFTYARNGQGVYGVDMHTRVEGEVVRFPAPEELWGQTFATRNVGRDRFAAVPFEDRGVYFITRTSPRNAIASCSRWRPAPLRSSSLFRSPGSCSTAVGT